MCHVGEEPRLPAAGWAGVPLLTVDEARHDLILGPAEVLVDRPEVYPESGRRVVE